MLTRLAGISNLDIYLGRIDRFPCHRYNEFARAALDFRRTDFCGRTGSAEAAAPLLLFVKSSMFWNFIPKLSASWM
jgi:hypothetical protein